MNHVHSRSLEFCAAIGLALLSACSSLPYVDQDLRGHALARRLSECVPDAQDDEDFARSLVHLVSGRFIETAPIEGPFAEVRDELRRRKVLVTLDRDRREHSGLRGEYYHLWAETEVLRAGGETWPVFIVGTTRPDIKMGFVENEKIYVDPFTSAEFLRDMEQLAKDARSAKNKPPPVGRIDALNIMDRRILAGLLWANFHGSEDASAKRVFKEGQPDLTHPFLRAVLYHEIGHIVADPAPLSMRPWIGMTFENHREEERIAYLYPILAGVQSPRAALATFIGFAAYPGEDAPQYHIADPHPGAALAIIHQLEELTGRPVSDFINVEEAKLAAAFEKLMPENLRKSMYVTTPPPARYSVMSGQAN